MGMNLLKTTLTTALVLASLNAWSTEADPSLSLELSSTMSTMNQKKASLNLESEVVALDNDEYLAAEKQTIYEINKLGSEIKDLERQQRSLTKDADRARLNAELATKRLQLKQTQKMEAQNRMTQAANAKKRAEHSHSQVKAKVELTEQQLSQAKQRTSETLRGLREIERDNAKLKARIAQVQRLIAQEKRKKDSLRSKRSRLTQQGQNLRNQLAKLESR